jgi:tetratricopeptide (TPR) repeat protein
VAGDLRGALFAYQDAVYLQPSYPFARVKLGRAYLALRYPAQAIVQAEQALALDPGNGDAQRLADEARRPARPVALAPAPNLAASPRAEVPASAAPVEAAPATPRVYRLSEEQAPDAATPAIARTVAAAGDVPAAPTPAVFEASAATAPTAADRYRAALQLVSRRDYAGAVRELTDAIAQEPRLAVAYAARASAQFGLGRYRDAADDYKAALGLDPHLGTPLYGLAECYRLLGDPAAKDMYDRYVESHAADVREDLRALAQRRARELSNR